MHRSSLLLVMTLGSLVACAAETPLPSTAIMPPGALGTNGDIDTRALDVAAFDFAVDMKGQPARAAEAIAALDYMGGKLTTSPRWIDMPPLVPAQMLQSRQMVRQFIGISQTAPSQDVVDTMLALAQAYQSGNQAAITRLLAAPIFILPPAEVAARLGNVPRMTFVNAATTRADGIGAGFGLPP